MLRESRENTLHVEKKSACMWSCTVQTHVVQVSAIVCFSRLGLVLSPTDTEWVF